MNKLGFALLLFSVIIILGLTTHVSALSYNDQLKNNININIQHILGNNIHGGPPQSAFGYFFTHNH